MCCPCCSNKIALLISISVTLINCEHYQCCNHPYLFDGIEEKDSETGQYAVGQHLVDTSGKVRTGVQKDGSSNMYVLDI